MVRDGKWLNLPVVKVKQINDGSRKGKIDQAFLGMIPKAEESEKDVAMKYKRKSNLGCSASMVEGLASRN